MSAFFALLLENYEYSYPVLLLLVYAVSKAVLPKFEPLSIVAFVSLLTNYFVVAGVYQICSSFPELPRLGQGVSKEFAFASILIPVPLAFIALRRIRRNKKSGIVIARITLLLEAAPIVVVIAIVIINGLAWSGI